MLADAGMMPLSFLRRLSALSTLLIAFLTVSTVCAQDLVLLLSPKRSMREDETHAALAVASGTYSGNFKFSGRVRTVRQLREGSPANPWECAWLVWRYVDNDHFYYLALKPTGWELGKRDPSYSGGQYFLVTGSEQFPVGVWTSFVITAQRNRISIDVEGRRLVDFVDHTVPSYASGNVGLYTEDAIVALDLTSTPMLSKENSYPSHSTDVDGSMLGNLIFPFLGFGSASIQAISESSVN